MTFWTVLPLYNIDEFIICNFKIGGVFQSMLSYTNPEINIKESEIESFQMVQQLF
jgi:hypothetical protein